MIIWTGRGVFTLIFFLVTLFICSSIFPKEEANYSFIISFLTTGLFSWYFGKKWNSQSERIVVDKKTGKSLKFKNKHSLFWIPMQYWGIIFLILSEIVIFRNSVIIGIISTIILLIVMLLPLIIKNTKNKSFVITKISQKNSIDKDLETGESKSSNNFIKELKENRTKINEYEPSDHSRFMPK